MTRIPTRRPAGSLSAVTAALSADVVVGGGGPAATWAALGAAESGADVVLADKGYRGTSGLSTPDDAWSRLRAGLGGGGGDPVPARQVACADHPVTDPGQQHRQLTGGLDEVWVRAEPLLALAVA